MGVGLTIAKSMNRLGIDSFIQFGFLHLSQEAAVSKLNRFIDSEPVSTSLETKNELNRISLSTEVDVYRVTKIS